MTQSLNSFQYDGHRCTSKTRFFNWTRVFSVAIYTPMAPNGVGPCQIYRTCFFFITYIYLFIYLTKIQRVMFMYTAAQLP